MRPAAQADRFGGGRRRYLAPLLDLLLWASLAAVVAWSWTGHRSYPFGLLIGGLAVWGGAVAAGRRLPLVPLFAVVLLCALDGNYSLGLPLVSYLVGRRMASTWPAAASYSALTALGTPLVLSWSGFVAWATMAGALVYAGLFPWLVGRYQRQQRALVAAGWEQAEQLEREQRMLAREVRLRERARIAEDMHDSLGHELSLLALRAGALELSADLDERTRAVAGQLRAGAAAATGQLRDIIDVLRDDDPDPAGEAAPARDTAPVAGPQSAEGPQPAPGPVPAGRQDLAARSALRADAGGVADLVRRARAAGMPVELHDGRPAEPLPPLVGRAVYRVVQESLTNANKHAPGAAVSVRLGVDDTGMVLVSVTNARPAGAPRSAPVPDRGGRGLVGLRERVRLAGGTLHTDARDGGFEVVARLPGRAGRPGEAAQGDPVSSGAVPTAGSAADRRRRVHREARRGLVAATMVLATFAGTLGGAALGYYLYATGNSVLSPERYAELRVGQDWATALPLLPRREMLEPPDPDPLPVPAGADCRYYRSHGDVLQPRLDVYRLCAAHGKLVSKDLLPAP
ncbi:sensor histidine kinase [Plantactinospora sp. KLBMP9567]|uniref:sensor histidine kinase n=1 Tax=Plantactinospora sp. KLBMP9567 TaxID=3085900 RepID=UPI002981349C|nr:histidine kinase [Plantactinospora sp. KLBMP9567]MDW5325633.1 histidine kinase [Plantactinospora sp. KLBMP9567]